MLNSCKLTTYATLLCSFSIVLLAGCQQKGKGELLATYSGSIEGGSEMIVLTSDQKYTQKIAPGNKESTLFDYTEGTWLLLDSKSNLPVSSTDLNAADLKHENVILKKALGPEAWQENHVKYIFLDRSIPASDFRLAINKFGQPAK